MIPLQRQQSILQEIKNKHVISILELASNLNVSHMTIRRDIQKLEEAGLVVQVSGGVRASNKILNEPTHYDKEQLFSAEKSRIGKIASELITKDSCIYLDAGTTSLALCEYIKDRDDLIVVTNDFEVSNYLIKYSNVQIIHTGGCVRNKNLSTVGHLAANTISLLKIDIAFLSASSFDIDAATTPDVDKVIVKQAVIKASSKKVLISDSSKYKKVASYVTFFTKDLDVIVTDNNIDKSAVEQFKAKGIEVYLA